MKLLIDTNVILDFLLDREPFSEDASRIFKLGVDGDNYEYVSSSAMTDIWYNANRALHDSYAAQNKVSELLNFITILEVTGDDIKNALALEWKDFEDAVQYCVALAHNVDYIITRNTKDYKSATVKVLTPGEFLSLVSG